MRTTTEIFQGLLKAGVMVPYDGPVWTALLKEFAPDLLAQYLDNTRGYSVVYVWRDGDDVLYVGKSKNWKYRLTAHLVDMLCQKDLMYQHFYRAHEAGTLNIELIFCQGNLDKLEEDTVIALTCPTMYNVEFNPGTPNPRKRPAFSTMEELKTILANVAPFDPPWMTDSLYLEMQARLRNNGFNNPVGDCVHCGSTLTFRKLHKHEPTCLHRHPQSVLDEIKAGAKTTSNRAKYIKTMSTTHASMASQVAELIA